MKLLKICFVSESEIDLKKAYFYQKWVAYNQKSAKIP